MAYTLTYTLNSDGNSYTLSGYSGDKPTGELVIPDSYDSKPVTSIGNTAFSNCSGLTSITIPNSVTSIGQGAFLGCYGLTSITIGSGVTSIGAGAFSNCSGLTSISVASGNTKYHSNGNCLIETETKTLILGCKTSIIPTDGSVTSIGNNAFYYCYKLTSITIPNSVTSIGDSAFSNCSGLTSITIPNSVTSIGNNAFHYCSGLTSVTIPDSVTSIGNSAFFNCTSLTSIVIPDSVTSIGDDAFCYCSGLTSITIGSGVTSIGSYVFSNCTSLTSINVASGNIKYHSNGNCLIETETKTIIAGCKTSVIPSDDSVTSIGAGAFSNCSGLTSITIPNSVTSIGQRAFYKCTGLTSINIPNSVTSIDNEVFRNCTGLTSVTIPNSVTSIGNTAFEGCTSLTSIVIPDSVTSIGDDAFYNTAWYNNKPNGVVYAGKVLYEYKGTMPKNTQIKIVDGTKGIADYAFYNCTGLTSIAIPNSVTSIGSSAFEGCTGLTSIIIGSGVAGIGDSAFKGCSNLTKINMLSITPPTISNNTLDATVQNIYVPSKSGESYKTATNWNTYADKITEFPILDLGSLLLYNNKVKEKMDADGDKNEDTYAKQNGSYSNLTAGKANIHTTELLANNANLNNYYGADYWGKNYYAAGNNSIVNRPIESDNNGFSLEILRGGAGGTIQRCTIYAAGGSATQPVVFTRWHLGTAWKEWQETAEPDGTYPNMTVGEATNLTEPFVIGSDTSTAQAWVCKFATITLKTAWVSSATRFEIVDTNYTNNTTQPVGVEISASPSTTALTVRAYALYGNPQILNTIYISHSALGTFPMTVDLYYSIENTAYTTIGIKPLWQSRRSTNSNVEFITTNTNVSALPADRTNIRLTQLANYAVITRAGYDGNGNNIANTYAKKAEISNPNLLVNPDFSINQRGQMSYSGGAYGVDRWLFATGTTAEIQESGELKLTRTEAGNCCLQRIEDWKKLVGKTVTLSVKFSQITAGSVKCNLYTGTTFTGTTVSTSGSVSTVTVNIPTDATKVECFIYANSACEVVPEYAKLEIGSVATPFVPPLTAEELLKCQRYGLPLASGPVRYPSTQISTFIIDFTIPTPVSLRTPPTLSDTANIVVYDPDNAMAVQSGFTFEVVHTTSNAICIRAAKSGHGLSRAVLGFTANIFLDAEIY